MSDADETQEAVVCPECKGESNPPANDTVAGWCWLCLGGKVVTKSRAAEAVRISQEDVTPVVHTPMLPEAMPSRRLLERSDRARILVAFLGSVVLGALLTWCIRP